MKVQLHPHTVLAMYTVGHFPVCVHRSSINQTTRILIIYIEEYERTGIPLKSLSQWRAFYVFPNNLPNIPAADDSSACSWFKISGFIFIHLGDSYTHSCSSSFYTLMSCTTHIRTSNGVRLVDVNHGGWCRYLSCLSSTANAAATFSLLPPPTNKSHTLVLPPLLALTV